MQTVFTCNLGPMHILYSLLCTLGRHLEILPINIYIIVHWSTYLLIRNLTLIILWQI